MRMVYILRTVVDVMLGRVRRVSGLAGRQFTQS